MRSTSGPGSSHRITAAVCVADAGDRNQQIVPGLQILILPNGVLDRLIEGGDFRFQPGDHPGHGGVGRRGVLARAAPVGPLHP